MSLKDTAAPGPRTKRRKTRYNLPMPQDSLAVFQLRLSAILAMLAIWVLAGFFLLQDVAARWTGTLEGQLVIEISMDANGTDDAQDLPSNAALDERVQHLASVLNEERDVAGFDVMGAEDVQAVMVDIFGEDFSELGIAYPRLLSVQLKEGSDVSAFVKSIEKRFDFARVETRGDWLDVLKRAISWGESAMIVILAIVFAVMSLVIGSSVRARLKIMQEDLAVLHLIGATDSYIAGQVSRHSLWLVLKGCVIGVVVGFLILFAVLQFGLPDQSVVYAQSFLSSVRILAFACVPAAMMLLSGWIARLTAYQSLRGMA
tara:strand:- start:1751 stop:2698 length:948 start_codon:yes stop_codon:yes gene_type:complete